MPRGAQPPIQEASPPANVRANMRRTDKGAATGAFASGAYREGSGVPAAVESDADDDDDDDEQQHRGRGRATRDKGDTIGALPSEAAATAAVKSSSTSREPSSITPQGGGARARNSSRSRSGVDDAASVSPSRSRSSSRTQTTPKERGESLTRRLSFGLGRRLGGSNASQSQSFERSATQETDGDSLRSGNGASTTSEAGVAAAAAARQKSEFLVMPCLDCASKERVSEREREKGNTFGEEGRCGGLAWLNSGKMQVQQWLGL